MPEQQSARANVITEAPFEAPFSTALIPFGLGGLNLLDDLDKIPPEQYSRLTNAEHTADGILTSRPGQTSLATGGTQIHSVRRFADPQFSTATRIWGIDADLYRGLSGALVQIDTGYSGDPLSLVPHRPPLSGDPWLFVGDRGRMRKVRFDGLDLPIGLPAPAAAPTAALDIEGRTEICAFTIPDGSGAPNWTPNAGTDTNGVATGVPTTVDGGTVTEFRTQPGGITTDYTSWWSLARVLNLNVVTTYGIPAVDDDFMHLTIRLSHPHLIDEVRLYFVVSAGFDLNMLPGTDSNGVLNTDAYVKTFRSGDFAQYIQAKASQIDTAETARIHALRDTDLTDRAIDDDRDSWAIRRAAVDPERAQSLETNDSGFLEWGVIGTPLRRGDFKRIGQTAGRDWSTVTGIVVFMRVSVPPIGVVSVALGDCYLTGGSGPDTAEPGAQQYDYRTTDYDPRTGAESNPGPEMAAANHLDSLRRRILVTPPAAADAALRQRLYRRGGSLIDDWYFLGVNAANGGVFTDGETDDGIASAGTLALDHFQPVPTIDDTGATVLAQPVPALWGPLEGMLFACGDPYRPGHLYFCLPDAPDHWSASGNVEVCPPSEALMHGGIIGHQAFVFSRERLYFIYPSLSAQGAVDTAPTLCKRGLKGRWAFCVGPGGIYFCAEDGIFRTIGGEEEWLSRLIDPLFKGKTVHGYLPIDLTAESALRLTTWENKLYFLYQDTGGERQVLIYDFLLKFWRHAEFGRALSVLQGEQEDVLVMGSLNLGAAYTHEGFSDAGLAIDAVARTGSFSGGRREEKLFGDQIVDCDRQGLSLTLQNFLNEEVVTNLPQAIAEGTGRQRYILDSFGIIPQRARSLSTELRWSSAAARPLLYQMGTAITLNPDITINRVTNWDDLDHPDESWVTGITLDVDTFNVARTVILERDFGGVISTIDTITVQTDGRHKVKFSWAALPCHQVRIRPNDECKFWVLYRADWIQVPEPPRISKWDIHFENAWDQYYTGLDLYCDTLGAEKRIEVYVDEVLLTNPFTGLSFFSVIANGRRVVHLTLPWGRGHVFRFKAIDDNVGLLYTHRWHLQEEPSEQANFNRNFEIDGTLADKWYKAFLFEADTFGQNKTIEVQLDGVTVETFPLNTNGRKIVHHALTQQYLGRVLRVFPVDGNPGRSYNIIPIFDEEPYHLTRWETQESNHGLPSWFYLLYAHIVVKSTKPVTLQVDLHVNQRGTVVSHQYEIPTTAGEKQRRYVTFNALKGVLAKYIFTSEEPFYLYRDESSLYVQPWGSDAPMVIQAWGNDDLTVPTRSMIRSADAAARSGGGST